MSAPAAADSVWDSPAPCLDQGLPTCAAVLAPPHFARANWGMRWTRQSRKKHQTACLLSAVGADRQRLCLLLLEVHSVKWTGRCAFEASSASQWRLSPDPPGCDWKAAVDARRNDQVARLGLRRQPPRPPCCCLHPSLHGSPGPSCRCARRGRGRYAPRWWACFQSRARCPHRELSEALCRRPTPCAHGSLACSKASDALVAARASSGWAALAEYPPRRLPHLRLAAPFRSSRGGCHYVARATLLNCRASCNRCRLQRRATSRVNGPRLQGRRLKQNCLKFGAMGCLPYPCLPLRQESRRRSWLGAMRHGWTPSRSPARARRLQLR